MHNLKLGLLLLCRHKSLAHSINHLPEPEEVEGVKHQVAAEVDDSEPQWKVLWSSKTHELIVHWNWSVLGGSAVQGSEVDLGGRWSVVECAPHVLVDAEGLVSTPAETAGEESGEKADAVDELALGAGEVQFVEKPVEVKKWRRELVKDESRGVVVNEWALESTISIWAYVSGDTRINLRSQTRTRSMQK